MHTKNIIKRINAIKEKYSLNYCVKYSSGDPFKLQCSIARDLSKLIKHFVETMKYTEKCGRGCLRSQNFSKLERLEKFLKLGPEPEPEPEPDPDPDPEPEPEPEPETIYDLLSKESDLSSVFSMINEVPELAELLKADGDLIFFAPVNSAFDSHKFKQFISVEVLKAHIVKNDTVFD